MVSDVGGLAGPAVQPADDGTVPGIGSHLLGSDAAALGEELAVGMVADQLREFAVAQNVRARVADVRDGRMGVPL